MRDVVEQIVDGTSGLVTGSVGGCIVTGVCTKGDSGDIFILGNRSDLTETLGEGVLVTRIKDMMQTGGQNPIIYAAPVTPPEDADKISDVKQNGAGPKVTVTGTPRVTKDYVITIMSDGKRNEASYIINGQGEAQTIPEDGLVEIDRLKITFPEATPANNDDPENPKEAVEYTSGTTYSFSAEAAKALLKGTMDAIEEALEIYDVEFIYVTGESDSNDWNSAQVYADELFNKHRPIYFKMEAAVPEADADGNYPNLSAWVGELVSERKNVAAKYVQVCAQFGKVADSSGKTEVRNWAGLQAGLTLSLPVQRAHGRVRDGAISGATLPDEWNSSIQSTLEEAGYLTAKTYAGLSGAFWGDSRTLAEPTSDYQYEEVVRVVFKALRLSRQAALKSMYDELGDPVIPGNMTGAIFLQTNIENALNTMVKAVPQEMAAYRVVIPEGQDFVNNGVALELTFIGIPIIRQIKLFANYTYAGSTFDPRLSA